MKRYSQIFCLVFLGFLLGIHNGKIALWQDEDPQPIKIFPFSAQMLPVADRRALEEGIRFETKEDLMRLMEDYLS